MDEARRAIERALQNWQDGWRTKDARLAARDYADDADWTNAFGMHRRGRAEIEALLAEIFAMSFVMAGRSSLVAQELRLVRPDLALVRSRVERSGQRTRAGETLPTRRTSHLRVFAATDGAWRIVSHLIADARDTERTAH